MTDKEKQFGTVIILIALVIIWIYDQARSKK